MTWPAELHINLWVDVFHHLLNFTTKVCHMWLKYHSIQNLLVIQLFQIIQIPKPRSARWICSSVPEEQWNTPLARYCSAEYHTNNLLSPVLFEQASRHIPENAIVIEVAPHGLLQAILHRSLSPQCTNIALTQRANPQGLHFFLSAIGRYLLLK